MKHSFVGYDEKTGSIMFVSTEAPTREIAENIVKTNNPHFMYNIDTVKSPFTSRPDIGAPSWFQFGECEPTDHNRDINDDIIIPDVYHFSLDFSKIENNDAEFIRNQGRQYQIFQKKNDDYGSSNILDGDPTDKTNIADSLQRIYIRMQDKMSRLRKLISGDNPSVSTETIVDTLDDIANYANIAIIVHDGKWDGK